MSHRLMGVLFWLWSSFAAAGESSPENVNAWTVLGGLRGAPFGMKVQRDLSGCLDASEKGSLKALCVEPLLVEGTTFHGGVVIVGGRLHQDKESKMRLTRFNLMDSGKDRCERLRALATGWRALHKAQAGALDINGEGFVFSWLTGPVSFTFKQAKVTAQDVDMHRLYRAEAMPGDLTCDLLVFDAGVQEIVFNAESH